ncbi:MAG: oxidoreductase family protein [Paenibacillaceae bacterium]|nr:oxidoreductase family protein [Paenibacillaceae bacterium]
MIKAAVIGAGNRGFAYGAYALKYPQDIQIVAVASRGEERRKRFAELHGIPENLQFASWEELLAQPRLCEALLICTMDRDHYGPAMQALKKGYHLLLEKPMAADPLETMQIAEEAERQGRIVSVCHGGRYSHFNRELKRIVDSKAIGSVMTIQWTENVGADHYVTSFVRGNWRNSDESSSMILQKSCHDMDMLQWLIGAKCMEVSSYGKLTYFTEENAPQGSTDRCTDGCAVEQDCPFSAIRIYYHSKQGGWYDAVSADPTLAARIEAIRTGPYGRCVYRCDNNVVDHQVVNMLFDNDVTVSFTMSAFTSKETRTFKVMGTLGEIRGNRYTNEMEINYFNGKREVIRPEPAILGGGHGGSDFQLMKDFVAQVRTGDLKGMTSASESIQGHMIAFAAEHSRLTGSNVKMEEFMQSLKK